ncbi:hypothetical protein D0962_22115 [Leptolyngbyaceae cyanobacterium CCMR0082]|uniref:Uncharacterized protein n=2 Tax=Adonisia turfae TaxID=2950184 RepID=A0A6M0SBH5_9CYAN|nr:hypothetical protein [Adonisia turfae]EKV02262.1 hypothetical protein Lepto7375DRAFT_4485 [Leptolyngbya sp. PCC 7375]NEZ58728.1 hypothetical protein [Adonisia turfae CCMR0081]NEZ65433.1 hypothetical protein [Adonisia turfae CCMR0082]
MRYLVAAFCDRTNAEEAYARLESSNFSMDDVSILGEGCPTTDEFGLQNPKEAAWTQVRRMATWLVPFGFGGGFVFDAITGLNTFEWTGTLGNQLLGGLLGAGSGLMGSFFICGGPALLFNNNETPYRDRIDAGEYLVVVSGGESIITQAARILQALDPETIEAR